MNKIISKIKNQLNNETFVLAVSTGPDSMCLLDLCLKAGLKDNMIIAHVNHGLREESQTEEDFIISFAKENNIRLEVTHLSGINHSIEETSRALRYDFFKKVAKKYDAKYILLAHNADDNLETIIMRLIKSSSIKAYAGIEEISYLEKYCLYRPLLKKSKDEILQYNNQNNIKYFIDESNHSDDYLRNRIRNHITPILKEENPKVYEAITYFSESLLGVNNLLENEKLNFIDKYVSIKDDVISFEYERLLEKGEYLSKAILFRILRPFKLSISNIEEILKTFNSSKTKVQTWVDKNLFMLKEYGVAYFSKTAPKELEFKLLVTNLGKYTLPNGSTLIVENNSCILQGKKGDICYNNINIPFTIKSREDGDKIIRNSKKGVYEQKIANILTTRKVSTFDKVNTLLIEKDNKILAILGMKIK